MTRDDNFSLAFQNALQAGELGAALETARQWVSRQPEVAASHAALGAALQACQRPHEAIGELSLAIHRDPNLQDAYPWLCAALMFVNSPGVALEVCALARQQAQASPDMLAALADLFNVVAPEYARELSTLALLEAPEHQDASLQALLLHLQQDDIPAAETVLENFRNAAGDALHAEILEILLAQESGNPLLAREKLEQALAHHPEAPSLHFNAAQLALHAGQTEMAKSHLRQLLKHQNLPDAAFLLAGLELKDRNWETGFRLYESRRSTSRKMPLFHTPDLPEWRQQKPLGECRILVVDEQGFGDTLMFSRFLPPLRSRCAKLGLLTRSPLLPLFAHNEGFAEIELIASYQEIPAAKYDFFLPLLSLPERLNLCPPPGQAPYLSLPATLFASWHPRPKLRPAHPAIGLVWQTNSPTQSSQRRSLTAADALEVVSTCPADWYGLTLGVQQPEAMDAYCTDWSPLLLNFAETAAAIQTLDAVVSIDTSVAHLAAALGKPVLLLQNGDPEWRWSRDPEQPDRAYWYPCVSLLQLEPGQNWSSLYPGIQHWLGTLASNCHR